MKNETEALATAAHAASRACGRPVEFLGAAGPNEMLLTGRFRLENGLVVLLLPDPRAPVFAYQSWFRVGSRDEDPQRTGLAHLFEHLMFKGTTTHPTGTFDREMEARGTQTNAATWVDWTFYTEALASRADHLGTVIGFESDRMVNLVLDEATFTSELEVVKNERRMSVEDSVGGALSETLFGLAYQTHPYRWPTIGFMEHLEAATVDELRDFYRAYYAPNNATLVLVGDLDPAETLAGIARAYGPLPSQDIQRRQWAPEPQQDQARAAVIERPVQSPQVVFGYHCPPQATDDFAALEIINDALTAGDTARLNRRLVIQDRLATEAAGFVPPFGEPGLYEILIAGRQGTEPEVITEALQSELDRIARDGLTPGEIAKAKNRLELAHYDSFRDAESTAEVLGHYETTFGDFAIAFDEAERIAEVTPEAIVRVAQSVLRADNRTAVAAVPSTT